jgi:DNA-binding winged helix-turn-helix (wHTH) protein/tetratricopeptide (TPR) repeat protein
MPGHARDGGGALLKRLEIWPEFFRYSSYMAAYNCGPAMNPDQTMAPDFHLGEWRAHPSQCRLSRDGRTIQVRPKVMDLLVFLARAPGVVVAKETLLNQVWKSEAVSESALTRTVTELRQALGDSAECPRILETIPKRGYRLIARVSDADGSSVPNDDVALRTSPGRTYVLILGSLTALVVTGTLLASGAFSHQSGVLMTPGESVAVHSFAAREWVLVVPFVNHSGDGALDEVVELALERELVNSGFAKVVPRPRVEDVLALMKKAPDTRLDDALAREVAVRDGGIRALITGRIDRVGTAYLLTTNILDPADGRTVATISHAAERAEDVLGVIRSQAFDVRHALGETIASIERSREALAKVTTPSLKALQLYSRAASLLNGEIWRFHPDAQSRYASAEVLLTEATAIDPSFASAWLLLAQSISRQGRSKAEYLPMAERALQLASEVSDVERYFIEGFTHSRRGSDQEDPAEAETAARAFEAVLELAPDHYWTLLELVPVYRQLGRFADAERLVLHAADARPRSVRFIVDAARAHLRRGETTQARAMIERARIVAREDSDNITTVPVETLEWLRLWEAHEAWVAVDPARALAAAQRAEQETADSTSVSWLFRLGYVYAGLGRYEDALRVLKRLPLERYIWVGDYMNLQRGRISELREHLQPQRHNFDVLTNRASMLVWAKWFDAAEWVLAERRRRGVQVPWFVDADWVGQLRVEEGRYAEGLALLERLKPDPMGPRYAVVEHVALARRELGDSEGAIRELEHAGKTRAEAVTHEGWQVYGWLRCRVLLAEMYRDAGRDADSERVALEVRSLLRFADDDIPLLTRLSPISQTPADLNSSTARNRGVVHRIGLPHAK